MRLATLGINVGLSLASFSLGLVLARSPLNVSNGAERELVSGAAVSGAAVSGAAASAAPRAVPPSTSSPVSPVSPAAAGAAAPSAAPAVPLDVDAPRVAKAKTPEAKTPEAKTPEAKTPEAKTPEAEPSWSRVAARAQSWTAAVRADLNYGAGLIVQSSGLVLTNLHVINGAPSITVTPFGGSPSPAHVLDTDAELDLALLSAELPSPPPSAATLGSAAALSVGDEVLAVGSPRKMYFSVSRGMVSFTQRLLDGVEYIQTDLPINEGNSGGPLVDRSGRVVGIVSFILKESQGLSFALPIDRAVARFAPHLSGKRPRVAGDSPVGEPPRSSTH